MTGNGKNCKLLQHCTIFCQKNSPVARGGAHSGVNGTEGARESAPLPTPPPPPFHSLPKLKWTLVMMISESEGFDLEVPAMRKETV